MHLNLGWRTWAALFCVAFIISVPASADTINGVVTADGGGPVAGATVRTDGDPSYSAVTGTDGRYSVTVPLVGNGNSESPGRRWAVLASAAMRNPQRITLDTGGTAVTANFALRSAVSGAQPVNLPAPLSFGEPPSAPTPPGDSFPVTFSDMGSLPGPNVPMIADCNDCVKPDESFTIVGYNFTTRTGADAGTDTTVWVWARTSASSGVLRQARLWSVSSGTIVATMPDDVPFGMFLVWVRNSNGVSAPVCINKTMARLIGPISNVTYPGGTKRVFGRNLTYNHGVTRAGSSDPATSYVYIQPLNGGSFIQCPTTNVDHASAVNVAEPYAVTFTVPIGTPYGNYKVYVHNGHGGVYGWSDGLDLVVGSQWVRGTGTRTVSPGTDPNRNDSTAIQAAMNTVSGFPGGGTVQLLAGDYLLRTPIYIGNSVLLKGAGKDTTTLRLMAAPNGTENAAYPSYPTPTPTAVLLNGNNSAISYLTIYEIYGYGLPEHELQAGGAGGVVSNVSVKTDQGDGSWINLGASNQMGQGTEVFGCDFQRDTVVSWYSWMHDNNCYGDIGPWYNAEAASEMYGWGNVFENNHTETQNWPVGTDGTRNYAWWDTDPIHPGSILYYRVWAKRVALTFCSYGYMAHNTTKDVAVDDNRGEMFLFHGHGASWWGQVLSNDGLTVTVRTDGKVFDQTVSIPNYPVLNGTPLQGGLPVTNDWQWWSGNAGRTAVIIAGKGAGQVRPILWTGGVPSSNQIVVDRPWAVQPDSTSVVIFTGEYVENVVYGNDLNAFPPNYDMTFSPAGGGNASSPVQFANSYRNTFEANTARRNYGGVTIGGNSGGPCLFNEARDSQVIDAWSNCYNLTQYDNHPLGPVNWGNRIVNCSGNTLMQNGSGAVVSTGQGSIIEDVNMTGSVGYLVGWNGYGDISGNGSPSLFRNGTVTANTNPYQPDYIRSMNGGNLLANNTYSGNSQPYWYNSGVSSYSVPIALYRAASFKGYVNYPIQNVLIPIVNAGTNAMTWTVTASAPWITATIQSNGTLSPENTSGRLAVGANIWGMDAGTYSGSVTVNAGGQSVKIGVTLDLVSGTPPDLAPNAVFSATPTIGTAPRLVSFNAGSSNDPNGSIQSYYWDFGDGSYGTGVTPSHTYPQGTYTPILTVTDDAGLTGNAWTNITVSPSITSVTLSGTPGAPIDAGTPVTLTAGATGGYQTQFRFFVNSGSGWVPITAYQSNGTTIWTPSVAGYYEVKAYAKASDSTNAYDVASNLLSYPVGQIPRNGMALWLKADSGVTIDPTHPGLVTSWTDQSGSNNNVTQANSDYEPSYLTSVVNGRPVVRFGGGSQMLQAAGLVLAGNTNFTSFEVVKLNAPITASTYQYFWWNGDSGYRFGYGSYLNAATPPRIECGWGQRTPNIAYPNDIAVGTWYRISSRVSGAADPKTHEMWVNGGYFGPNTKSGSSLSGTAFSVGNFGPSSTKGLNGDIAEILIYNRDLSESERTSVESYLSARWIPATAIAKDRIRDVKALADGVLVNITSAKSVIAASGVYSDTGYYIEEPDRTVGIKVVGGPVVSLGDNVTVTGVTGTDPATGEKILTVTSLDSQTSGNPLGSLGVVNKALSSTGQLVRVWGKVTNVTSTYVTLDDGSGSPLRIETDGLVVPIGLLPTVGQYMSVAGPAGTMAGGVTAVRPRSGSDIQVY